MRLWEVGHVGVFDLLQQYWPVAYQIAKGKQGRNSCATAQLTLGQGKSTGKKSEDKK